MRKAIGIVRGSQVAGREGESFVSPREQHERLATSCERDGIDLAAVHEELDVSGGASLRDRDGLRAAVEAIEAGQADVLMVAYFDRLVRSLAVQGEVVERVEAAGGRVVALDIGEVSGRTAAHWLSGTMLGAVAEYHRRSIRERSGEGQARAVARGVAPWPLIPPGYLRGEDGRLEPDTDTAPAVVEAFAMRAEQSTIAEVRTYLRRHGIERSYHGVQAMLGSRVYLGEIHFGDLVNLDAHPAIIERAVWDAVQGARVARGPRPASDRLLARLGVLRCGTCGARMVVGVQTQNGRRYPFYRCPPVGDCPRRVTVGALMVEDLIVSRTRDALAGMTGRASAEGRYRQALVARDQAQSELDAAIRAIGNWQDSAAVERLADLRAVRDQAQDHLDGLGGLDFARTVDAGVDFDEFSVEGKRALIRETWRVHVDPGRGLDRLRFELLIE